MKSVMQQKRKSNRNNFKSIRVKEATKKEVDQFLKKINKNEHTGKVSFDDLIKFFMEKVTVENIQSLQLNSVNWEHEDKRLRKLFEKQNGKISEAEWRELIFLGKINDFVSDNSRLPVGCTVGAA